jgi:hypothetical protein
VIYSYNKSQLDALFLKFIFGTEFYMFRTGFLSIIGSLVLYDIYPLLCVQIYTPDDRQRNCPKHVEFYSKNKFEKLVHLVGFITRRLFLHLLPTEVLNIRLLDYFDVLTSIVSFIWAPSTRGGVAYGVRTLSTNRNSY